MRGGSDRFRIPKFNTPTLVEPPSHDAEIDRASERSAPEAPLWYRIDPELGIVELFGQESESDGLDRLIGVILGDSRFRLGYGFLRDRRGLEGAPDGLVRARIDLVRHLRALPKTRWAIVIDPRDLPKYGLTRLGLVFAEDGAELAVFADPSAARYWLVGVGGLRRN